MKNTNNILRNLDKADFNFDLRSDLKNEYSTLAFQIIKKEVKCYLKRLDKESYVNRLAKMRETWGNTVIDEAIEFISKEEKKKKQKKEQDEKAQ